MLIQLVTQESPNKKALENPDSGKLMADWDGSKSGLPFFVVLNGKGEKIADSNRLPGGKNIGCPATPQEVEEFDKILNDTAPRIKAEQRAEIAARFRKLNEKH